MADAQVAAQGSGAGSGLVLWMRRRRRVLAACLPLVLTLILLGLVEVSLRLAGFGGYPRTFEVAGRLEDGSRVVMIDPDGPASYFFANRSGAMAPDVSALRMPKPTGTIRVMWVGESAAKGIPQPRPLRAASILQAMLSDVWPDRRVEVINLGTPGIASYPVLGIMTEALDYQPDVVVVYLGNNEFYGAFGVASLHTAGRSPASIRLIRALHSTAIAQAVNRVMAAKAPTRSGTLMEAMVGQSNIGANDPARAAAARTLEAFVGDMIDRCRRRGVPIVVCTPPCNERDMWPLGEPDLSGLPEPRRAELKTELEAAVRLLPGAPAEAESAARRALAIDANCAAAHHALGRALVATGRGAEAATEFRLAVDLDPMPWRPPTSSVAAIRRAVESRGAVMADLEQAFRAQAPHGSPGWELMDDHVHPSLAGQELAARTVLNAMAKLPGAVRVDERALAAIPEAGAYTARLGENRYEAYGVATRMAMLGNISFFKRSNPEMFQRFVATCDRIEAALPAPLAARLREWSEAKGDRVDRYPASAAAALSLQELGQPAEAEPLFRFAAGCADPYSFWRLEFTYRALEARLQAGGRLEPADVRVADEAIADGKFRISSGLSKVGGATELWTGRLSLIKGDAAAAVPYLVAAREKIAGVNRVYVDEALVQAYRATGRLAEAKAILEEGLRGEFAGAYRALQK